MPLRTCVRTLLCMVLVSAVILSAASSSFAATHQKSATINVSATIPTNCTVSANALSFGIYDAQHTNKKTPLNAQTQITFACTKSATQTLSITPAPSSNPGVVPGSQFAMKQIGGTSYLGYNLSLSPTTPNVLTIQPNGGVSPSSSPQTATLYGTIPADQKKNPPGNYTDAVLVVINF